MTHRTASSALGTAVIAAGIAWSTGVSATDPSELCTGSPCVITSSATLDAVEALDFGDATALRLAPGVQLSVADGPTPMNVWISAGSIVLESGARIVGRDGSLALHASAGGFDLQAGSMIRFAKLSDAVAELFLTAQNDVTIDGDIVGKQSGAYSALRDVDIVAGGAIRGAGIIDVRARGLVEGSLAPEVQIQAGSEIGLDGAILADAGCRGGWVSVFAGTGPIRIGTIRSDGLGCDDQGGLGSGGQIAIAGAGEARVTGQIRGRGRGTGADIVVGADHFILEGSIDARGRFGDGGVLRIDGGDFTMSADARVRLANRDGVGSMTVIASDFVNAGNVVLGDVRDTGTLDVDATGDITVLGKIVARGAEPIAVALRACGSIDTQIDSQIRSRNSGDVLLAGDAVTVSGSIAAEAGTVYVDYVTTSPLISGSVDPSPVVNQIAGCTL